MQASGCTACGSFLNVQQREQISLCGVCDASRVRSQIALQPAQKLALDWYTRVIGPHRLDQVPLQLSGLSAAAISQGALGYTQCTSLGSQAAAEIYLAKSLHELQLATVLVHEYTHVLLFMDTITARAHPMEQLDLISEEGTCQLASMLFLETRRGAQAEFLRRCIEQDPSPVYGDGYRMMREELKAFTGLAHLLSSLTGGNFRPDPTNAVAARSAEEVAKEVEAVAERHRPTLLIPTTKSPSVPHPRKASTPEPQQRPIIRMPRVPTSPTRAPATSPQKRPTIHLT
jgi:hypothetical protein